MSEIEVKISEAFKNHTEGNLAKAGEQYLTLLNQYPEDPQLLYLLGTLRYQLGDLINAHAFLAKAILSDSENIQAKMNFALVLQDEGLKEEAISQLDDAIRINSNIPEIYNNRAALLLSNDKLKEAELSCEAAINLRSDYPDAYNNLGLIHKAALNVHEAEICFRKAIDLNPQYSEALANIGALLCEEKKYKEAIDFLQRSIDLSPFIFATNFNLARALVHLNRLEDAKIAFNRALELEPSNSRALEGKIELLSKMGSFAEAQNTAFFLLANESENTTILHKLASLLIKVNLRDESRRVYEKAILFDPNSVLSRSFQASYFSNENKLNESLAEYNKVLEEEPSNVWAYWNRALVNLLLGNFKKGFEDFDWRFHAEGVLGPNPYEEPEWDGKQLNGEGVLIHSEQGLGDILQFMRYIKGVQERGGNVIFNSGKEVYKLLVGEEDSIQKTLPDDSLGKIDELSYKYQIPLLSLPKVFDTSVDTIPWNGPYVSAPEKKINLWKEKFKNVTGLKVGIVWAGNPDHQNDHNRSCRLNDFLPLASIPGIRWYVLQKGKPSAQANSLIDDFPLELLDKEIKDFSDTAAIVKNLDLVISVDTSVVHLAGAMGVRTWTLLAFNPDWRWLIGREDTPWYPSMRLFRQDSFGDWSSVFIKVHDALCKLLQDSHELLSEQEIKLLKAYELAKQGSLALASEIYSQLLAFSNVIDKSIFNSCRVLASDKSIATDLIHLLQQRKEPDAYESAALIKNLLSDKSSASDAFNFLKEKDLLSLVGYRSFAECLFELGDLTKAEIIVNGALKKWPNAADLHFHLGRILQRLGQAEKAKSSYENSLSIDSSHPRALNNLSVIYFAEEDFPKANNLLQALVRSNTDFAMGWANLGRVWSRLKDYHLSEIYLRRAIELSPEVSFIHMELGAVLFEQDKLEEALTSFKQALLIDKNYADGWAALASAQWHMGDIDESMKNSLHALSLNSENVLAHTTLSWCYLPKGDFYNGWREYEWRFRDYPEKKRRQSKIPRWDGSELGERKLLVHTEQGFGDAFQFVRFLPLLNHKNITLECQDDLVSLLRTCPYVTDYISWSQFYDDNHPSFDVEIPLMSLPHMLQLNDESQLGMKEPYFFIPEDCLNKWRQRFTEFKKFRIGIVWAGNPNHGNDRRRSCRLLDFANLADIPEIDLFSLQKGSPGDQALQLPTGMSLINIAPELNNFIDTAAVIKNLDLVIAVDTAVVHLAGALGKPVWVLLPTVPDWRWMKDREDNPWYPSVRIFRQTKAGDWDEVMKRVAGAIKNTIEENTKNAK